MYLGQPWTQGEEEQPYDLMRTFALLFFSDTVELFSLILVCPSLVTLPDALRCSNISAEWDLCTLLLYWE